MNKILLALFSFFVCFSVEAQKSTGTITGKVNDGSTGEVIDHATINLHKKGSGVSVRSYMTDQEGRFSFSNIPFGIYQIKVSFVGYEEKTTEDILIDAKNLAVDLGGIRLIQDEATTLEEVVVTPNKPMIEFGADSIIFNVEGSIHAEGSTASDLMMHVPMVNVDVDGNPTIAGAVNTRIFIDGKPSDFTAETVTDLLNVLPSEAIQKIEVITNPEERYSADGDGIINIVLKKGYKLGLSSGLSLRTNTLKQHNGSAFAAYSDGKLNVNGNYGYRVNRNISNADLARTNFNAASDITSYMNQLSNALTTGDGHNGRAALNWDITPMQNLRASVNYNQQDNNGSSYMDDYRLNASEVQTQMIVQENFSSSDNATFTFNADYTKKFKRDRRENLTAGITFFDRQTSRDRNLDRTTTRVSDGRITDYNQYRLNDLYTRNLAFNIDYVKPLSKLATLSVGSQITMGDNGNDQLVTGRDFVNQEDTVNRILTNKFEYQENIYAAYASFRYRIPKGRWSFRAGVRSEYTDLKFTQTAVDALDPRPYYSMFPNISINKNHKKKYNFGFSYSMRISRPRENALNPLIDDTNLSNVRFGNPNLKPSYINNFQLSFGTAGDRWSFTPRLRYSSTTGIIQQFRITTDSVTFENLGRNRDLTLQLHGNYRFGKSITVTGGYMLSRRSYESASPIQIPRTGYSERLNFTIAGRLPHKIALEGQINYFSNAMAQGKRINTATTSLGVRKNFLNNKLTARLVATDPFLNRNSIEFIDALTPAGNSYSQERSFVTHTTNYAVTLSYRFSNAGKQKAREKVREVIDGKHNPKAPANKPAAKK